MAFARKVCPLLQGAGDSKLFQFVLPSNSDRLILHWSLNSAELVNDWQLSLKKYFEQTRFMLTERDPRSPFFKRFYYQPNNERQILLFVVRWQKYRVLVWFLGRHLCFRGNFQPLTSTRTGRSALHWASQTVWTRIPDDLELPKPS